MVSQDGGGGGRHWEKDGFEAEITYWVIYVLFDLKAFIGRMLICENTILKLYKDYIKQCFN